MGNPLTTIRLPTVQFVASSKFDKFGPRSAQKLYQTYIQNTSKINTKYPGLGPARAGGRLIFYVYLGYLGYIFDIFVFVFDIFVFPFLVFRAASFSGGVSLQCTLTVGKYVFRWTNTSNTWNRPNSSNQFFCSSLNCVAKTKYLAVIWLLKYNIWGVYIIISI